LKLVVQTEAIIHLGNKSEFSSAVLIFGSRSMVALVITHHGVDIKWYTQVTLKRKKHWYNTPAPNAIGHLHAEALNY